MGSANTNQYIFKRKNKSERGNKISPSLFDERLGKMLRPSSISLHAHNIHKNSREHYSLDISGSHINNSRRSNASYKCAHTTMYSNGEHLLKKEKNP